MDLSIIMVNWKSADFCEQALKSIYATVSAISFEVIVIDNASFDNCETMLAKKFPAARFIQSADNLGFAGANNRAVAESSGRILCFLNPDTIVDKSALNALYAALETIPDAGAVGALLKNRDGSVQTSCVLPFPTILNQALDFEWLRRRFPRAKIFGAAAAFSDLQKPQRVDAVSGACIMMSRALFLEIGMFSTDYFMYAEDIDLCHKVVLSGRKVYLINTAEITHFGGGSSTGSKHSRQSAVLLRDSNFKLLCKFRSKGYAYLYRASLAAAAVVRLTALLAILIPAAVTGRGATVIDALLRWGYLLGWAIGIRSAPRSFGAGAKKP